MEKLIPHLPPLALLALIPLVSFLDGLGGGRPQVPGRGSWYAVPILASFFVLAGYPIGVALCFGLFFYIWRDTAPAKFGGRIDSRTNAELAGTFARHSIACLLLLPLAVPAINGGPALPSAWWLLLIFPFIATAISAWLGDHYRERGERIEAGLPVGKDVANNYAEWARGAALGAILAAVLLS